MPAKGLESLCMLRNEALPVPRMGTEGLAEGVRESLDPMAESRPGRGEVPRGNGAGLASASGKNAEMRLSVFPSAPWPVPCLTLLQERSC